MPRPLTQLIPIAFLVVVVSLALTSFPSYSQGAIGAQGQGRIWYSSNYYVSRPSGAGFYLELPTVPFALKVISLNGNAYDRGFEYGYLAGPEIYRVVTWLYNEQAYSHGVPLDKWRSRVESLSKLYVKFIPDEFLEEMTGIADGFNSFQRIHPEYTLGYNLTQLDIIAVNTIINITGVGAAISGNLTETGASIIGTTLETQAPKQAMVYIVETPAQGHGHRVAYYTLAGRIFQDGFNDAGLGLIANPVERWSGVVGVPETVRNRIVIQYADNVTEAIRTLIGLQEKYGFSGLGDDLAITDEQGNIAKVEVTPFKVDVIVNPEKPPTWPPEDPYLPSANNTENIYSKLYLQGYSSVLRGYGWIVNSLYTLNKTVTGVPGHPENWSQATSPGYSWMWSNPKAYLLAHYIYDHQLRHSQLSLEKLVEFTQTPPFAESPSSAGVFWMEPQLGIVSIVNGYPSLGKPVYIDVFIPVPNLQPCELSYREIYTTAMNLRLSTVTLTELITKIQSMIHTTTGPPSNIDSVLENMSRTLVKSSAAIEQLSTGVNEVKEQCIVVQRQGENISEGLNTINSQVNRVAAKNNTIIMLQEAVLATLALLLVLTGYIAWRIRAGR